MPPPPKDELQGFLPGSDSDDKDLTASQVRRVAAAVFLIGLAFMAVGIGFLAGPLAPKQERVSSGLRSQDKDSTMLRRWDSKSPGIQATPAKTKSEAAGTTLFCFIAVLPGSPEELLVNIARENNASIFDCEGHSVYHSVPAQFKTWDTGDSTLVNTAAFLQVWQQVKNEGAYLDYDWTAKVDADCVFMPHRLQGKIAYLKAPANQALYLHNTMTRFMDGAFLGALEVTSKLATTKYIDNLQACTSTIGTLSGEDGFMKDCLNSLQVPWLADESIMHPSPIPIDCQMKDFAAFHPFKAEGDWRYCYEITAGLKPAPGPVPPGSIGIIPTWMQKKYS
mmetsp:Transcript_42026/g.90785  ORF Transcript_42026/g.90785 Transcript_42026/m.90785 type:complete len:336 (-) Transcript_42026:151-1158(-)